MAGMGMHLVVAKAVSDLGGFGRRAVVAIRQARTERSPSCVDEHHGWALAGQRDRLDVSVRSQPANQLGEGGERR
jgi:hypothetical protein